MPESSDSLRVAQVYTEFDTKGLSSTEKSINSLKGKLNSVRNVLAGIVGAFTLKSVAGSFVAAAKSAEDYRTSIRAVSKSIEEADAAFDRVRKWAAVNPVDTDEAVGAFVRLRTAAVANAEEALNAIADVSTVMHADMRDVASAVVTTETESLRQYGILLDQTGKKAVLESNGIRMEVDKNINAIRAGIIELMGRAFGGSMQEARDTFSGTLDTMSGMWTEFQQDIMGEGKNSGPFETLKSTLHEIRDEWEAFTQSQDYSKLVSGIQSTLVLSIETATSTIRAFGNAVLFAGEHIAELKAAFIALASYRGALAITTAVATFNEQLTMGMGLVPSATSLVAKMGRAFTLLQVQVATASTAIGGLRAAASALMASLGPAGWAALIAGGTAWLVLKERMEDAAEQAEITQRAIASVNQEFADANSAQIEKALKDAGKELAALEERALSAKLSLMELWNAKETYSDEELIIPEIGVALPKDCRFTIHM